MTREELLAANKALLVRRKKEGVGQPKPIDVPAQAIISQGGMTLADYFALQGAAPAMDEDIHTPSASLRMRPKGRPKRHQIDTSRARWDSFDSDRHPSLQKAVRTIKKWYKERLDAGGGLILAGNYGSGKSHLAQAIYDLYGFGAIYLNELKLVQQIQAGYGGSGGRSLESIAGDCRRARLLIYDDLGSYETDNLKWIQNVYMALFDGRFEEGKALLTTTNLKLLDTAADNLIWSPLEARLGGRVYSRIMGAVGELAFYVDLFDVPDYRLRNFP